MEDIEAELAELEDVVRILNVELVASMLHATVLLPLPGPACCAPAASPLMPSMCVRTSCTHTRMRTKKPTHTHIHTHTG